jgi:hypothetical protein
VSDAAADGLEALRSLRAADPATRRRDLRPLAIDPQAEPTVRAAAIVLLAQDGAVTEHAELEAGAPPVVVAAAAKAAELRRGRDLVAAAVAREPLPSALFDVPALPPGTPHAVEVTAAGDDERRTLAGLVAANWQPLAGEPAAVPLITLGRCQLAILVDPGLPPESLHEAPARPASIATRDLIDGVPWSLTLEVLSVPRPDGVALAVIDRRGRTRYVGSARPAGDGALDLTVYSVDQPSSRPLRLTGRLEAGRIGVATVEAGSEPGPRLSPAPLAG